MKMENNKYYAVSDFSINTLDGRVLHLTRGWYVISLYHVNGYRKDRFRIDINNSKYFINKDLFKSNFLSRSDYRDYQLKYLLEGGSFDEEFNIEWI